MQVKFYNTFNSLGNKKDDLTIIYTPAANLKVLSLIDLKTPWMIKLYQLKENRRYGCGSGLIPQRQKGTSLPAHYLVSHSPIQQVKRGIQSLSQCVVKPKNLYLPEPSACCQT